ncbi:nucleoside permease [Salinisphaera sp. Q1T1-3]|uniref:nucleoside permease n=1 Tax=Salinisphaera sp. Q1T1-3 TaxID=2321229 RepID=UPI000E758D25|nr:nucleoside permease [Salinisphaera sp. Q1T1-3]RJS93143.1 MFS transporter [Salinisphaera sp. Q1T1-3]
MIRARLSIMMFLEFFIWGGWFVTLGTFLGSTLHASDGQIGMAFATQSWGAIVAPFIIGLIADRFFNAERILGILHLVGAVLMYRLFVAQDFSAFYITVLVYMILYMPTLALVNAVAFRQLREPDREFGKIRVWGSLGWIAAGLAISYVFAWDGAAAIETGALRYTFLMCAVASLVLGIYSFTLPATPPKAGEAAGASLSERLGIDALKLLKNRDYAVFFVASILICIPLAFYYQNANPFLSEIGVADPTAKMTLGQISEVFFMLMLPLFIQRVGIKKTLLLGMLAWGVRYLLFAFGDSGNQVWMLLLGILLHGLCYDFFFVSGQIYTNQRAGERFRSAAQGMITLATYGFGMLIGFWVAGAITDYYSLDGGTRHDWQDIWLFPAVFALAVMAIFFVCFRGGQRPQTDGRGADHTS